MSDMFCFQCQQTAGNKGCTRVGVCGKQPETANLQDELVCELICLAEAAMESGKRTKTADRLLMDGLFTTLTNVNFDNDSIRHFIDRIVSERKNLMARRVSINWNCGKAKPILYLFVQRCSLE